MANSSISIIKTDGGPHPADKWAMVTADHLVHYDKNADASVILAAKRLELAIVDILVPHHHELQQRERQHLGERGDDHLVTEIDPTPHLDKPVEQIVAAARGTPFESHFAKPEVQAEIRRVVGNHFATSMHVERSWHVDRNPHTPAARAFRAAHHGG